MIGKTVSHYKILEKLGEGGMGEIYRAQDLDLNRTVALKFLKKSLISGEQERKRFQREARAAASLDHPNICTVYEIGQTDDHMFMAMACVEGQSLQERVRSGPLGLAQAVDIGIQIAEGLHAAHQQSIVHRDVKSGNVLVDKAGHAKITDFGLALRPGESRVTQTGATVGTSFYMSPEQCRGEDVDNRTDLWSLGVVLYEMITGRLPFEADHDSAVVYAILNRDPEPVTGLRSRVPLELDRIVDKALSKDRGERYQHADELVADLRRVRRLIESSAGEKAAVKGRRRRRRLSSPATWIALAAVAVAAVAVIVFYPSRTVPFAERDWMIIADFENETGEELFDGVVNGALAIDLQQSQYVNVFSRQRVDETLRRMGRESVSVVDEQTAREIAQREGLGVVLAGTINKVGSSYILSARIVLPSTGDVVKTVRVDANDSGEVLDAIDELSKRVRRDLGESIASIWRRDKPLEQVTTNSLQALQYYSMASKHMVEAQWDEAIPLLRMAIEEDSSFAIAYSKLGVVYNNMRNLDRARYYSGLAREKADRVTERERYYIEARYFEDRAQRKRAIENFKLLVGLYPDDFDGHNNLAFEYQYIYEYEKGLVHAREAVRLRPGSWYPHHNLTGNYAGLGEYQLAIESAYKALSINPDGHWTNITISWIYGCQNDLESGLAQLDKLPSDDAGWQSMKYLNLVRLHRCFGQDNAAMSSLRTGIPIDELAGNVVGQSWKWRHLGDVEYTRGNYSSAVEAYERARNLSNSAYNMMYLGTGYAAAGRWTDAEAILAEFEKPWAWEKTHTDLALIEWLKGGLGRSKGDYDRAARCFARSIVFRENLMVKYRLGRVYVLAGQYDRAIAEFEFILGKRYGTFFEGTPSVWPLSYYQLGIAHQGKGEEEKAADAFERFLAFWKDADEGRAEILDARRRLASLR